MPPFRPANLNKRSYPGNASVIGPTCATTLGITTTTCCSSTASCGAAGGPDNVLGCRFTHCCCSFCNICCSCPCTVCDRTIPSGRWKVSEQYEARTRDAWGNDNCVTGSPTCLCCTNVGTCVGPQCVDCKGFFICCGPSTCKWFVAPSCTQVSRDWHSRNDLITVTNSCMGSCGWFLPTICQLSDPGYCCRSYWDSFTCSSYYSNTENTNFDAFFLDMSNGGIGHRTTKNVIRCQRAFRCVTS